MIFVSYRKVPSEQEHAHRCWRHPVGEGAETKDRHSLQQLPSHRSSVSSVYRTSN